MTLSSALGLGQTALELGLINSLTVLALFLSYSMLNVCDLSTDGCFTLGACVGAVVAISGHPWLALPAAMCAGVVSGFVTALLQTRMGVESLLAGIIVNTALYSINIAVMGNSSLLNMNKTETVFTKAKTLLKGTALSGQYKLLVALVAVVLVIVFLSLFLRTRLGLAIRATGNNPDMVRSSSINPVFTTTVGLCVSNSFTALSGCLLAQSQKSVNIDIGTGMVREHRHRHRHGDHRPGQSPDRRHLHGPREHSEARRRRGAGLLHLPPRLCDRPAFRHARLHAEAGLLRDCRDRHLRPLPEEPCPHAPPPPRPRPGSPRRRKGGALTC